MKPRFGWIGVITGAIIGGVALLGDNQSAVHTYVIVGAIVFGCGLIAGAIEGKTSE